MIAEHPAIEAMIKAAVASWELCGNMRDAAIDAGIDAGFTYEQCKAWLGPVLVRANERIASFKVRP